MLRTFMNNLSTSLFTVIISVLKVGHNETSTYLSPCEGREYEGLLKPSLKNFTHPYTESTWIMSLCRFVCNIPPNK